MRAAHVDVLAQRLSDLRTLPGHRPVAHVEVRLTDVQRLGQGADLQRFLACFFPHLGQFRDLLAHRVTADALRQPPVAALDNTAYRRAFPPTDPDRWPR